MADPTDLTVQTVTSTAAKLTFTDADTGGRTPGVSSLSS